MARLNPTRTPSGILTFLGGLLLLAVFAWVIVSWIKARGPISDVEQKRTAARIKTREEIQKKYDAVFTSTGWTDKNNGLAHIPLADAMKLTIAELHAKKVAPSSVKVEPPLPAVMASANASEAPPPALPSAPQGAYTVTFNALTPAGSSSAPAGNTAAPATAPAPAPAPAADPAPAPQPAPAPAPTTSKPEAPAKPSEPAPQPVPAAQPAPAPAATSPAPANEPAKPEPAKPADSTPATPPATEPAKPDSSSKPSETPPAPANPQPAPAQPAPESPAPAPSNPAQ